MPGGLETCVVAAGRMRAFVGGCGPPVVLLHGLGGAARNWELVSAALTTAHRVVAPDLPGHGVSPPLARAAGLDAFADTVADALAELDVAPALVVGHSFGGQLAVRLAVRHPGLVRGLLLVAPAGIATRTRAARALVALSTTVRPGRAVAPLVGRLGERGWFRRAVLRPWFVADHLGLDGRAARAFLAELRSHTDVRTAGRAMTAGDPRFELEWVCCPALVLWGARDPQLPLDDCFEYARRLRARVRVIADCGHLVMGERPDAVADAVAALERGA